MQKRWDIMKTKFKLPKVGLRVVKTCISCLIVAVIYEYVLGGRNPCFACIGAVYGMGNDFKNGVQHGFNRFVGTLLGGLLVIPFYWLYTHTPFGISDTVYLILGLFCVIYLHLLCGAHSAIQPGTVVYFVVMFTQPATGYVSYTIARIIDTGVGAIVSWIISATHRSSSDKENGISLKDSLMHWVNMNRGTQKKN